MTCPILKPMVDVLLAHRDEFAVFLEEDDLWRSMRANADVEYFRAHVPGRRASAALNFMCTYATVGRGSIARANFKEAGSELDEALRSIQVRSIVDTDPAELASKCRFFERQVTLLHGERRLEGDVRTLRDDAEKTIVQRVGCIYIIANELAVKELTEDSGRAVGTFLVEGRSMDLVERCVHLLTEIQ